MRKRIITIDQPVDPPVADRWLNVEELAQVEVSSEDEAYPVESALALDSTRGWRAAGPGEQIIRLRFDRPQVVRRIMVVYEEHEHPRTQEFVLRWSSGRDAPYRDIVRQQWNFSPPGNSTQVEDYRIEPVELESLELTIVPDVNRGPAFASLRQLRLS